MKLRDIYRQKHEVQLEELIARLSLAKAKIKQLAADTQIAAHEELADTEHMIVALKGKLAALNIARDDAWEDI